MGLGAADDGAAHRADFSHSTNTRASVHESCAMRSSGVARSSASKHAPAASASATDDSLISTPCVPRGAAAAAVRMASRRAADDDDVPAPPSLALVSSLVSFSSSPSPGGRHPGQADDPSPPATSPRSSRAAPRAPRGAPDDSSANVWSSMNADDRADSRDDGYSSPSSDSSAGDFFPPPSRRTPATMDRSASTAAVLDSVPPFSSDENASDARRIAASSALAHASTWSASPPPCPACFASVECPCVRPAAHSPATCAMGSPAHAHRSATRARTNDSSSSMRSESAPREGMASRTATTTLRRARDFLSAGVSA